jgi:hypothetical protein
MGGFGLERLLYGRVEMELLYCISASIVRELVMGYGMFEWMREICGRHEL